MAVVCVVNMHAQADSNQRHIGDLLVNNNSQLSVALVTVCIC